MVDLKVVENVVRERLGGGKPQAGGEKLQAGGGKPQAEGWN